MVLYSVSAFLTSGCAYVPAIIVRGRVSGTTLTNDVSGIWDFCLGGEAGGRGGWSSRLADKSYGF